MNHTPDTLRAPTVDAEGRRRWIYPDRRSGRLSRIRRRLAMVLLAVYVCVPFVTIQGLPLLRFDVLQSIVYVLGKSFHFSEAYYLVFVLLSGALALGFVTSLWGRVWCGYACPQTVFVEWVIRPIEEWIEGPALHRKRLDMGAKDIRYWGRKVAKHGIYIVVIWLITNAFIGYFVDPRSLFSWMLESPTRHWFAFVSMLVLFSAIYFDLVWFREQFCSFLCPYARFQSVMISRATPTVAYDTKRGEPRGKQNQGDCIDCGLCVRVCPTGIDIRNGLQLECIQCGRCVDACHTIMTNVKRPVGLIRTTSELELTGQKEKRFRWRPMLYLALLFINLGIIAFAVSQRQDLQIIILRQTGTTYSMMDDHSFGNYFSIRVVNQSQSPQKLVLIHDPGVEVICALCDQELAPQEERRGLLVLRVPDHTALQKVRIHLGTSQFTLPLIKPKAAP